MYGSKHLSNVALFPLCDPRGVLIGALRDTSDSPATRGDALVFAWRLELPDSISVAEAANALLVVAMNVQRKVWTRHQLLIIRELMVLAGREGAMPAPTQARVEAGGDIDRRINKQSSRALKRSMHEAQQERLKPKPRASQQKETKQWWKLVGKQDSNAASGQRKTRKERVSREP